MNSDFKERRQAAPQDRVGSATGSLWGVVGAVAVGVVFWLIDRRQRGKVDRNSAGAG